MDAGAIKTCPKCGGAWAGNIMYCPACKARMPDNEEPKDSKIDEFEQWRGEEK